MSELRYHPFLETWVMTATHRQDRTFLPPSDFCPLCPTQAGGFPTEIPAEDFDIVVFENRFPSLRRNPEPPAVEGLAMAPVRPSNGVCEVVVYTPEHAGSFADLSLQKVERLVRVWKDRYVELSSIPEVEYVFIFENKGREIGVTLSHPHGQIYAYPYIPATLAQELASERRYWEATGKTLWGDWLGAELADGRRVIVENSEFVAVVPYFARYPFEVWVVARREVRSLALANEATLDALADLLLKVARAYDRLFGFSLPYVMAMHQEPAAPGYEFTRLHVEFYPPHRTHDKLKYLAGSEAGAGAFINDTLPESSAARLRACVE